MLFADIGIEMCTLYSDERPRFIIEVEGCRKETAGQIVELHRVSFLKNHFVDSAAIGTRRPSCSAIEMTDVHFSDNRCSGVCGAALSEENRLRGVRLRGNRPTDSAKHLPVLLSFPPGSQTVADGISMKDNRDVVLLRANASTVSLSNVVVSGNSLRNAKDAWQTPSCIRLENESIVEVQHSVFEKNRGLSGVVFYATRSVLSLTNCTFRENAARENGSALLAEESDLQGNGLRLIGNSATNGGGCFALESASRMNISDSTWVGNRAAHGGAADLASHSVGILTGCLFQQNSATGRGGAVNTQDASLVVRDSLFEGGSADEGGFVVVMAAELEMTSTVFRNGTATTGGAIRFKQEGNITMHNVTFAHNLATSKGGALYIYGANVTSDRLLMEANTASDGSDNSDAPLRGGAMYSETSVLHFTRSVLRGNSANYGGAIILLWCPNGTFVDVDAAQNSAFSGGAFMVFGSTGVIRNASFDGNTATLGGSITCWGSGATLNASDAAFKEGTAHRVGGFIFGNSRPRIFLQRVSMTAGTGNKGGAVWLEGGAQLWAENLWISNSRAEETGGAVSIDGPSIVSCHRCVLEDNAAGGRGGGLYFASSLPPANALHFSRSTLWNNNADYGGQPCFPDRHRDQTNGAVSRWTVLCGQQRLDELLEAGVPVSLCDASGDSSVQESSHLCWRWDVHQRHRCGSPELLRLRPE